MRGEDDTTPRDESTESLRAPAPDDDIALNETEPLPGSTSPRSPGHRAIPPELRDRYSDVSFLGEGGMGTVFRARDRRLGRDVALKLLRRTSPADVARFLQEARAQARIQHENVCRIYDAGDASGEPYIVMQLLRGEPLGRVSDQMSLEQKVMVVRQVAAALHEAHRVGLIHRDIKPGNILVERGEDASFKPYVVDFGLAREVTARGQTLTGAVLGTPAYMAPEQARGDVRALDRRTDVYSLGVTLYDLVAGRTPFVEEQPWKLVLLVASEDPPPLGRVKKGVPADLETVVMKCLERDPARRYESARALGEDLQRFLDGEPVLARRAGLLRVLGKKARKHRLATSIGALAAVGALTFTGLWVKAQRDAEARATLGRELGEDVKEMELFLRAAYELPLHDVERERDVVRARLARIEERMRAAGRLGEAPGHSALGRGYLALGDPERAREHLVKALAAGDSSPESSYSLGQALGELYRREMEAARRIPNEAERKRREAEIAARLRDPALSALRAAAGARIEVPEHAEGLIAFYEGKYEEALAKAAAAFEKAPWMYEAKRLQADSLFALGSRYRHDAAFDHDKMMVSFGPAADAYRTAADIARSDPEVHRSECSLWTQMALSDAAKGQSSARSFERAMTACDRAIQASSADRSAVVQRALVLLMRANVSVDAGGEDAMSAVEAALKAAEEAVRVSPGDATAQYNLGGSAYLVAQQRARSGLDASTDRARVAFEEALRIDPAFTWAIGELAEVFILNGELESWKGADPGPSLEAALRQCDRAIEKDPTSVGVPLNKKANAQSLVVEDLLGRGRSPEEALLALQKTAEQMAAQAGGTWLSAYWSARTHRLRARHALDAGRDPRPSIAAALAALRALGEDANRDYWLLREAAEIRLIEAQHAIESGADPVEALREGRGAARGAVTAKPAYALPREILARIEIASLRRAIARHEAEEPAFAAAFDPLRPLLAEERAYPGVYDALAEVHWLRASQFRPGDGRAEDDVREGLSMAEKALSKNPHLATALAIRGELELLRARSARDTAARRAAAARAKEALDAALRERPLLERRHREALREIATLLS